MNHLSIGLIAEISDLSKYTVLRARKGNKIKPDTQYKLNQAAETLKGFDPYEVAMRVVRAKGVPYTTKLLKLKEGMLNQWIRRKPRQVNTRDSYNILCHYKGWEI